MRSTARLCAIQTPKTNARAIVRNVATSVIVSVTMLSCHRPTPKITAMQTMDVRNDRTPPKRTDSAISDRGDEPPW